MAGVKPTRYAEFSRDGRVKSRFDPDSTAAFYLAILMLRFSRLVPMALSSLATESM
jgi:hypothetical protein